MQSWEKKYLSRGGKELMLKTVAQALLNYSMGMFLFPQQFCDDMEKLMNKYWWKSSGNIRGIHWLQWGRMCQRKSKGGIGFGKLQDFNVALRGKQGWRLVTNTGSLVEKVYRARYYAEGSFLTASLGSNPSYIWRSIMEAQVLLKQGQYVELGRVAQSI